MTNTTPLVQQVDKELIAVSFDAGATWQRLILPDALILACRLIALHEKIANDLWDQYPDKLDPRLYWGGLRDVESVNMRPAICGGAE